MISRTTYLNMTPYASTRPIVYVSQYDIDTGALNFYLYNDGASFNIPSGYRVTIVGAKPDNTVFSYECSYSGNHVTADLKEQMTLVAGDVTCEISIQNSSTGQSIGTFNFILRVEESPYSKATLSRTDIDNLHTIIKLATDDATNRAETAANSANASATSATGSANAAYSYLKQGEQCLQNIKDTTEQYKTYADNIASDFSKSVRDTTEKFTENVANTAEEFKEEAKNLAEQYSREAAKDAESWAIGGTGTRAGEDMNNSKYYSELSRSSADDAVNAAKLAKDYSTIVMPDLYLDGETGILYEKTGVGVDVILDEDSAYLCWKITVG